MKKTILTALALCAFFLNGCAQKEEEELFSLSAEEQAAYIAQIDQVTEEFYWNYDSDSLSFSGGVVPENTEENRLLFAASNDSGYSLQTKGGSPAVVAVAKLLHYNGDTAGEVQFLFTGKTLSGVYYKGGYDNSPYSLKERNPFLADGGFIKFENWQGVSTDYKEIQGSFSPEGFASKSQDQKGRVITASIRDGRVDLYRLSGNTLSRYRTLTPSGGLEAVSVVFVEPVEGEKLLAVLLAEVTESGEGESEKFFTRSEKVALYNADLQIVGEIPLENERCTALGSDQGQLFLFADQNIEYYTWTEGGFVATGREALRHGVTQCHITDLDGNGVMEYLMSDGMDLYLYHRADTGLIKIWSTHLGVESLYGSLFSGDLNRDGVKEIYACDATGTAIRYILTERGLRSSNEDIAYGQALYPCDWNHDGIDDYWKVADNTERKGSLFLSRPAAQ